MRTPFNIILAELTLALLAPSPPAAHATYTLTIQETDSSITTTASHVFSGATFGPGTFTEIGTEGTDGTMVYSGTLGALKITVVTAIEVVSPTEVRLSLNNMDVTSHNATALSPGAPATLEITLTQTNNSLTTPNPSSAAFSLSSGGTLGGGTTFTTSATMTPSGGSTTLTPSSWLQDDTATVSDPVNNTSGTHAYSTNVLGNVPLNRSGDLFTLQLKDTFTFTSTGTISSFESTADASVPEPGTLALLGSGLPLLGLSALRRRHKKARLA